MAKESLRSWHAQKRYLEEHYRNFDGVRIRPTGEPATTVQTSSGPLEFTSHTRLRLPTIGSTHEVTCPYAPSQAARAAGSGDGVVVGGW